MNLVLGFKLFYLLEFILDLLFALLHLPLFKTSFRLFLLKGWFWRRVFLGNVLLLFFHILCIFFCNRVQPFLIFQKIIRSVILKYLTNFFLCECNFHFLQNSFKIINFDRSFIFLIELFKFRKCIFRTFLVFYSYFLL